MIRILHVIRAMDRAGAETLIMNIYRQLDKSKIQFDFLVHTEKECDYDSEILSLGGKIYRLPEFYGLNTLQYKKCCRNFFSAHPEHSIIHGHIGKGAPIYLHEARRAHRITIAHAHSENFYKGLNRIAFKIATFPTRYIAENFIACSPSACRATFGRRIENTNKYTLLKNGIHIPSYICSREDHLNNKKQLNLTNKIVFCHIGRFVEVKNHQFLIKVFSSIKEDFPDSVLLLCGTGPLLPEIKKLVSNYNLNDSVLFLGSRNDIPNILKATDVFIFPSINEGIGLASIEAQAAGAICILSTGVPQLAIASTNAFRIPLSKGHKYWKNKAISTYKKNHLEERSVYAKQVADSGYDINRTALFLEKYYATLISG